MASRRPAVHRRAPDRDDERPVLISGKPRRVDKAFIQPPQGNTIYTYTDGEKSGTESIDAYMAYTVEMVRKYPDRFIGCFVTTRAAA